MAFDIKALVSGSGQEEQGSGFVSVSAPEIVSMQQGLGKMTATLEATSGEDNPYVKEFKKINAEMNETLLNSLDMSGYDASGEPSTSTGGKVSSNTNIPSDTLGKIRLAETGTSKGKYGIMGDVGDGAGISVGAYQMNEKSGKAQKLAKRMGFGSIHDKGFKSALNTDAGRKAQDSLFIEEYSAKPLAYAKKYGIKDKKTLGFMLDTHMNGGLDSVVKRAEKLGGVNMKNLIQARRNRYASLISSNPEKFGKFKNTWNNRVNLWV